MTLKQIGRPMVALALLTLIGAVPAWGGIYYRAITTTDVDGKRQDRMTTEAWVDGEAARIEFRESKNPMAPVGSYLVTEDGGKTVFLINPQDRTYAEWELDAMLRLVGTVTEDMGPLMSFDISRPNVELLSEEEGDEFADLPTQRYKYRTTYDFQMKVVGIRRSSEVETVQDLWVTEEIEDSGMGVWLRKDSAMTGNEDLDALISAEMGKLKGFPLYNETVTTTKSGKKRNKVTVSRTVTEVTELKRSGVARPDTSIPEGFEQVQLFPATGEEEEGGLLGGLLKRGRGGDNDG